VTRLRRLIVVILLLVSNLAYAQTFNGQNEMRYARGSEPNRGQWNYFENNLELDGSFDQVRLYIRQRTLLPSEYGVRQSGLPAFDKKFIELISDKITVRGGDFYRMWGRGLLFGTTEILPINFDSGLDGFLVEGSERGFDAALFRGVQTDSAGTFVEAAEGAYLSYRTPWHFRLGTVISHLDNTPRHPAVDRTGLEAEGEIGPASLYGAYSFDQTDFPLISNPRGFYGSGSLYGNGWGILFDYKNYHLLTFDDPALSGGASNQPSLQYPPTSEPEQTMYLLDRHPRIQHYDSDLGYQIEATGLLHDWQLKANYNQANSRGAAKYFPSLKETDSPYRAIFLHGEKNLSGGDRVVIQGGGSEDVEFTQTAAGGYSIWLRRAAAGAVYEVQFDGSYSASVDVQYMRVREVRKGDTYDEQYLALTGSKSPAVTATAAVERSGGVDVGGLQNGSKLYWPSLEMTVNIPEHHQARIFYGYERGGLRCSGGVCRFVNPFKGVKLTLTSQF
jgi:hypothetical protein